MSKHFGLIGGTVFYEQDFLKNPEHHHIETEFGKALIIQSGSLYYVPRHGLSDDDYTLPHEINHPANLAALKNLGIKEVIGVCSTGTLRTAIPPGSLVAPHDYISLYQGPTAASKEERHIIPALSKKVRGKILLAAKKIDLTLTGEGVYWQSPGPRLETKAEVRLISGFADIVGMTMASEASVSQELGLAYASICSVDNFAHGLSSTELTEVDIRKNAQKSTEDIFRIVKEYIEL